MKLFSLMLKNLSRNVIRSVLTAMAVAVLVFVFSMVFTVLRFLDRAMEQKETDIAIVITERYRIPSRFSRAYLKMIVEPGNLNKELEQVPGFDSDAHNLWHFVGFTTDPTMKDRDRQFFCIGTQPEKIKTMIDGMEDLDPALTKLMTNPPRTKLQNTGMLMGPERMQKLGLKVGDQVKATSISHRSGSSKGGKRIEMEFEIVGALPAESRWTQAAFIDYEYLARILKEQESTLDGTINLGWLKVGDQESAAEVAGIIENYIEDVKVETASSAVSRFLDSYRDIFFGVKFVLAPAIIIVMIVIVANAVGISVRERTREMAVLKVLGFRPGQILTLVLGEGVLLGILAGLVGAAGTYVLFNIIIGGIKIPIAFFPVFFVPVQVFWWGPTLGGLTAFLGGFVPAWNARGIKVSEVFSKVA